MNDFLFYVIASAVVLLSLLAVTLPNLLHGAVALVASFFATAAIYIMLQMEFLALAQIALYIGGIVVFMLIIILLTNDLGVDNSLSRVSAGRQAGKGVIIAGLIIALYLFFTSNPSPLLQASARKAAPVTIDQIGIRLLSTSNGFIVPFEVVSLLLLAALIGAVVLSRRENKKEDKL
ncbi:MAG: NADH-quinone oxidoreductase subunit J family protein [Candidatus Electronema sp. V4]|uniref:NADH-quinone oxidoreductase subunit J family protein n=1 Tax=Candidatus Electronema sp. V4 TaxID=3454756 RepID=UPI0040558FEE